MSILSALKQHNSSIDDLAKLPQTMIMQMAQKKEISADMVAPILARKAEMMDAVARTKSLQQPEQAPPSVLEQLIAKNTATEHPQMQAPMQVPMQSPMEGPMPQSPEQVGVGQIPVPERQYAGGGIVAFKHGDLVDLEDDMDEEDLIAEYADAMQAGEMAMAQQGADQSGFGIRYPTPLPRGGEPGIKDNSSIRDRLHEIVIGKESGGRRYDKEGNLLTSPKGALGERQVMPNTIKDPGFGIKAARNDSPDEIARVGREYLDVMLDKYKDPKTAMIAYNMGPGATDKWLKAGADMSKLPKETRGYIANVNLAEGGEVQHFANKGYVDDERSAFQQDLIDTFGYSGAKADERPEKPEWLQKSIDYFTKSKNRSGKQNYIPNADATLDNRDVGIPIPAPKVAYLPNANPSMDNRDVGMREGIPTAVPNVQAKTPEESYWDKAVAQMNQERLDLAKQKTEDRNMALLAAGLGMMGGASSNAFTNIGQGGLSGMQYLADANKQRAAQAAALSKNELTAQRYKELGEVAKGNQAGLMAIRQGELAVHQGNLSNNQKKLLETSLDRMDKAAAASANAWIKANPMAGFSLENAADIEHVKNQILSKNQRYNNVYQQLEGAPFTYDTGAPAGGSNVIKYDSKGKAIK